MEDDDEFTEYRHEELDWDWDQVLTNLCRPGVEWTLKGTEAIHFSQKELSRYSKAWYYSICAKFLPTTHVSDVIKDRAMLLYAIVTGKTVDMGQVIQDSIIYAIKESSTIKLPHPSLICSLCNKVKVKWSTYEILQQPKSLIDQRTISRFQQWEDNIAHPSGVAFIVLAPPDVAGPLVPPQSTSLQSSMDFLVDEVRELRKDTTELSRGQNELLRES